MTKTKDSTTGEREEIARIIARELIRQDFGEISDSDDPFDAGLTWPYIDQGEVDFGKIADAILSRMAASSEGEPEPSRWLVERFNAQGRCVSDCYEHEARARDEVETVAGIWERVTLTPLYTHPAMLAARPDAGREQA